MTFVSFSQATKYSVSQPFTDVTTLSSLQVIQGQALPTFGRWAVVGNHCSKHRVGNSGSFTLSVGRFIVHVFK